MIGVKNIFYIFLLVLLIPSVGYNQCNNCTGQYPATVQSTTSNTLTNVGICHWPGEYAVFNVTIGETYTWSTCSEATFDTQLTLIQNGGGCVGTDLDYNDDGCGVQSIITWTATFTGQVSVLLSLYNCVSTESECGTIQWACTSCGGGSDNYNNPGGTITTCSGNFYDTGGSGGNYGNYEFITTTFCPDIADDCINMAFVQFGIENNFDDLTVYDGPNTGSPVIGTYTGTELQGVTLSATNASGCLTFLFDSDGSNVFNPYFGWSASISCSDCGSPPPPPPDPPTDCIDGITVCDDATFSGNSSGSGSTSDLNTSNQGCLSSGENQSSWYLFSPATDGDIGFTISPGDGVDYDFAVWGPYPEGTTAADLCPPSGEPIRCSYASGGSTNSQTGSYDTGMGHPQHSGAESDSPPAPSTTWEDLCTNVGGCNYSVCLYDSWGDGWNGGSLTVQVNATNVLTNITLANGFGPVCYNFNVPQNGTITLNYTAGNFPEENSYAIFDQPNGGGNAIPQFDSPDNIHSESPAGNGWVPGLEVTAGEVYIIVIDNFSSNDTPFDLNWNLGGGATLDCTVLPVEMLQFSGKRINHENVLEWQTASELNADYFSIERAGNARDFETIGQVPASGNSNTLRNYSYSDPYSGESVYYRLKQVDFDGAYEYYGPVAIHGEQTGIVIDDPFPNPMTDDWINMNISTPEPIELSVSIQDLMGRIIRIEEHSIDGGTQLLRIQLSDCVSGVYQIKITDERENMLHTARVIR